MDLQRRLIHLLLLLILLSHLRAAVILLNRRRGAFNLVEPLARALLDRLHRTPVAHLLHLPLPLRPLQAHAKLPGVEDGELERVRREGDTVPHGLPLVLRRRVRVKQVALARRRGALELQQRAHLLLGVLLLERPGLVHERDRLRSVVARDLVLGEARLARHLERGRHAADAQQLERAVNVLCEVADGAAGAFTYARPRGVHQLEQRRTGAAFANHPAKVAVDRDTREASRAVDVRVLGLLRRVLEGEDERRQRAADDKLGVVVNVVGPTSEDEQRRVAELHVRNHAALDDDREQPPRARAFDPLASGPNLGVDGEPLEGGQRVATRLARRRTLGRDGVDQRKQRLLGEQ